VFPNLNGHPDPIAIPEVTGPINKHETGVYFGGILVGWVAPDDPEPYTEPPTYEEDEDEPGYEIDTTPDEPPEHNMPDDEKKEPFDKDDDWEMQLTIC
jgi:hypothetical protein